MSEGPALKKVLLVDDDPVLGRILQGFLESVSIECLHIASHAEAELFLHSLFAGENPGVDLDAVILDYYLDDGHTGLPLCRQIREHSELPVLMLTGERSLQNTVECLEQGADQYICKPFAAEELLARLKASVRARQTRQPRAVVTLDTGLKVNVNERELELDGVRVSLTEKESLLAEVLLRHAGKEVAKEAIVERVTGRPPAANSSRSIDMLVGRLRKKLAQLTQDCRILSSRNVGYKLVMKHDG